MRDYKIYEQERKEVIDYSLYYYTDSFTIASPLPSVLPEWIALAMPFRVSLT